MINNFRVLGVIPARGGSKRIPHKNIKNLSDKPLIAWTIEEAKKSKYIDKLIVSTDDREIADIARKYGAEVPFMRPEELSNDGATDYVVFKHAVEWLIKEANYIPDIIVQLRPTSPIRTMDHIDTAIEILANNPDADSVRTVSEPEQSPYKMYKIDNSGYLSPLLTIPGVRESFNLPQQDLPKAYKHIGYVDVFWRKTLLEKNQISGSKILPLILSGVYSGINTMDDWEFYEYIINKNKN